MGASPNSARPIASWPAPRRPTRPTISPACRVRRDRAGVTGDEAVDLDRRRRAQPPSGGRRPARAVGRRSGGSARAAWCRRRGRADQPAVAQHGDLVGELEHLVQPVRDVDHPRARGRAGCAARRTGARPRRRAGWPRARRARSGRASTAKRPGDRDQRALGARQAGDALRRGRCRRRPRPGQPRRGGGRPASRSGRRGAGNPGPWPCSRRRSSTRSGPDPGG